MMRTTADLGWLLTDLLDTPGVLRAIVLTEDGMLTARSETLEQDEAERQAAASSSLWTLTASTTGGLGGRRSLTVECEDGYQFVRAAGPGAVLAVWAGAGVDAAVLYQQADLVVTRLREHLSAAPRAPRSHNGPAA